MSRVLVKNADYDYDRLKPLVFEIMDVLGGEKIERNMPVLIKYPLSAGRTADGGWQGPA